MKAPKATPGMAALKRRVDLLEGAKTNLRMEVEVLTAASIKSELVINDLKFQLARALDRINRLENQQKADWREVIAVDQRIDKLELRKSWFSRLFSSAATT